MSQETQPLVYHSLSRHVQSIPSENDHLRVFSIYSSNQQPPVPSILERSRTKKSHEKSLKKGLSRVSKSKQMISVGQGSSRQDDQRQLSKGTLLNFNIQEVVDNKYHMTRPRDQVLEISPRKNESNSLKHIQTSQPGSNEKSFISEYRIVTYVPSGRVQDDKRQSCVRQQKESLRNDSGVQQNWDKQNNSNHSNVFRNNHNKNDSQSIQIINPTDQNNLEQNTWRTSENFDPYYSNNFGTEMNQLNYQVRETERQTEGNNERQQLYSSLKPKYSVPVSNDLNQLRNAVLQVGPLKEKIKHLEHEIVEIQREKTLIVKNSNEQIRENGSLREQNEELRRDNQSLREQTLNLREEHKSSINKMNRLNEHVLNLQQKIATLSQHKSLSKEKSFSESYLFQDSDKKLDTKSKAIQQTLRREILSLEQGNQTLSLAKAKLQKELSEKTLIITELNRKNKELAQRISDVEKQLRKEKQKIQSQQEKLYKKDEKINSLSLQVDRLNLLAKQLKQKQPRGQVSQRASFIQPNQLQSLAMDRSRQERAQTLLREQLQSLKHEHQQLLRDYTHLQKKHLFMKDQLQHLKYLQLNASSSALSHRSTTQNNNSINATTNYNTQTNAHNNTVKEKQLHQSIYELQTRLQISERNLRQVQEEYSNLKQNFRALEELYIKIQDQNYQLEQQTQKLTQEINKLKIQLNNTQQIIKAKTITMNDHQSLRFMQQQQELSRLKKDLSNLQRKYTEMERDYTQMERKYTQMERHQIQTQRRYQQTQRRQLQTEAQLKILQTQLRAITKQKDQSYHKYIMELQKNTSQTKRHQEDLSIYINKMENQQNQKITIVAHKYQALITKLNNEITALKSEINFMKETHLNEIKSSQDNFVNELQSIKQAHLDELTHVQHEHKEEVQTLLSEIDRQQLRHNSQIQKFISGQNNQCSKCKQNQVQRQMNSLIQSTNDPKRLNSQHRFQSTSKMSRFLNYQSMTRKQLQLFTTDLQSEFTLVQNKYKTLVMEKQRLQDNLQSTTRHLTHLQQQVRVYKQQKQNSLKQKYQLRQQVDKTNLMMLQMKKTVSLFDEQKTSYNFRINQLNQKYLSTVQDYQNLIQQLKQVKNLLYDKEITIENYHHDIRELRINLLEEKELTQKKIRQIYSLKEEKQAIKSKEQYYKMLFQKTQQQLELQLQQKALFLTTHALKVPNSSPIKHSSPIKPISPQKRPSLVKCQQASPKTRQTQLYRLYIFKDLNKLLNLTNQHFTFQQIIDKNQQQYLRMLYNAVKEDHSRIIELKQLIVDMQQSFKKEKVFIKEDYDVLYEKYLKYKNMCQDMNRDIERYKLKIKTGSHDYNNFINIDV